MGEDYGNARTLASIEYLGETFRICRRRIDGKPWRKYLALVHGATMVSGNGAEVDLAEFKKQCELLLRKAFDSREKLLESLASILLQNAPS